MQTMVSIVADDLTGALDASAPFARRGLPAAVAWSLGIANTPVVAWDAATRECAVEAVRPRLRAVRALMGQRVERASLFVKIDSILRGHPAELIAAALTEFGPATCIVAPAFPHFGRVTVDGRQRARLGGEEAICLDLQAALGRLGVTVSVRSAGEPVPAGASLWNASTDDDLDRVAAAGTATGGDVIWCGSGGLAAALARRVGREPLPGEGVAPLPAPELILVGTDHPVTQAQVAASGVGRLHFDPEAPVSLADDASPYVVTVNHPVGVSRASAADGVARACRLLMPWFAKRAAILVTGGETLRALCDASGATRMDVIGEALPGVPVATVCGGMLDGMVLYSKSGGFGDPHLFASLLGRDDNSRNVH